MYYILTTFLEQCSSIYVNIKGGGTIPTLLNQVEWKLLCLASDVILLYTLCTIAVMCRHNWIWHCQHGGKCFQSGLPTYLRRALRVIWIQLLLQWYFTFYWSTVVPLSQDFKTERRYLSCDKNGKKYYTDLQNSDSLLR